MSNDKMTPLEFAEKVDHEGGLHEAIVEYGLHAKDLNRADDPGLFDNVLAYERVATDFNNKARPLVERILERLDWHEQQAVATRKGEPEQEPVVVEDPFGVPAENIGDPFDLNQNGEVE